LFRCSSGEKDVEAGKREGSNTLNGRGEMIADQGGDLINVLGKGGGGKEAILMGGG